MSRVARRHPRDHNAAHDLLSPRAIQAAPGKVACIDAAIGASTEDLQMQVKNALAPYKYPRWVVFVSELPKTARGKIQRFKLRAANH